MKDITIGEVMETGIGISIGLYLIFGFGVKNLTKKSFFNGFPLIPIIWPVVLIVSAFIEDTE